MRDSTLNVLPTALKNVVTLYAVGCALAMGVLIAGAAGADAPHTDVEIRQARLLTETQRQELARLVLVEPEARALWMKTRAEADALLSATPRPLAVISYEGLLHTHPDRVNTMTHLKDMDHLVVLAEAWAASGERKYRDRAMAFIRAWASTYKPTGNSINENKLEPVFAAYGMLRASFTAGERSKIEAWMRHIADREVASGRSVKGTVQTNWHSKRLKIVGLIGQVLGDADFREYSAHGFKSYVERGLFPDGTSQDLKERDALSYHQSGLKALLVIAMYAGKADGVALFRYCSPSGASLEKSVDYVLPYAEGKMVHAEWVNTKVALDRERAAAGLSYYQPGKPFDPEDALEMFELASYFDRRYGPLVAKLRNQPSARFSSWPMVLNEAMR